MALTNHFKTVVLLSILTGLVMMLGRVLGGPNGLVMALAFAAIMNMGAYWFSDKIVLKMHGARPVTRAELPEVYEIVEELARINRMPMPKVYLLPEAAPNAFATGRNPNHAAVAVTAGILELLDARELRGVLGHELGHVQNRDTLISSIAATFAGALSMLADMAMWGNLLGGRRNDEDSHPLAGLAAMILAPIAGLLIQSALSRSREFLADQSGAETTGDPIALASALEKIESYAKRVPLQHPHTATSALFIVNPLRGENVMRLFSTHPPTKDRVAKLRAMAQRPHVRIR